MSEKKEDIWTYTVLINGIGSVEIEGTKDIDSAYVNACEKYKCKISDVLAVGPICTDHLSEEQKKEMVDAACLCNS